MHSQFNQDLFITKDQSVVSLIRIGYHLVIVVESMGDDEPNEDLNVRWFDFVTKEKPRPRHEHHHYLTQGCSDFSRNCSLLFKNIKGVVHNKTVDGLVRECHEFRAQWSVDHSWPCDPEKAELMIEEIRKDIKTPPRLQYKGGPDEVNCTTWCWGKLAIAGIDARKETRNCTSTIIAKHNMDISKIRLSM